MRLFPLFSCGVASLGLACRGDAPPFTGVDAREQPDTEDTGDSGDTDDSGDSADTGDTAPYDCGEIPAAPDLSADAWNLADPGPGGDIQYILPAPRDPSIVYAASNFNGLFRSDDRGETWTRGSTEISHLMGQIAVDPQDASTIFYTVGRVYRSTTSGDSVVALDLGETVEEDGRVRGLLFRDDVVYAADTSTTIWRSEDLGNTWEEIGQIHDHDSHEHRSGGTKDSTHGDEMGGFGIDEDYWYLFEESGRMFAIQHEGGVHRSLDMGETWEQVAEGTFYLHSFGASGDMVWAGGDGELVISRDGGETFETYDTDITHIRAMAMAANGRLIAADEQKVFQVEDDGSLTELAEPEGEKLTFLASHEDGLLLGHRFGVLRSADAGSTWEDASVGLEDRDLGPMVTHPECPNRMWVGTLCMGGLFSSVEYGDDLQDLDVYMHYVMVARIAPSDPEVMWVTTDDRVVLSQDGGETWAHVAEDILAFHMHGLDVHPDLPNVVMVGSVGEGEIADDGAHMYLSQDWGETWEMRDQGLPDTGTSYHAVHFVRSDPDVVLMGTYRAGDTVHTGDEPGIGMFRSTDGAESWESVDLAGQIGIEVGNVPILAECAGTVYAATDGGLLMSTDEGETWVISKATETEFLSVACHEETVLAVGYDGVFRSDDGGGTWEAWDTGTDVLSWPTRFMPQVAINADGTLGYLTVMNTGLYQRPL